MTFTVRGWVGLHEWIWPRYARQLAELPAAYAVRHTSAFGAIADETVDMLVVMGQRLAPMLTPHAAILADGVARDAQEGEHRSLTFVPLAHIDMMAACASLGGAVPPAAFDAARAVLSAVVTARTEERVHNHWHRGLAAIALDWPQVYRGLLGHGGEPSLPFTPGERFHGDLHGLLLHLAAACEHNASPADVQPAWVDLLHNYRGLRTSRELSTACLFWAAWIIDHRLGGHPIAGFGEVFHETLFRAATDA